MLALSPLAYQRHSTTGGDRDTAQMMQLVPAIAKLGRELRFADVVDLCRELGLFATLIGDGLDELSKRFLKIDESGSLLSSRDSITGFSPMAFFSGTNAARNPSPFTMSNPTNKLDPRDPRDLPTRSIRKYPLPYRQVGTYLRSRGSRH